MRYIESPKLRKIIKAERFHISVGRINYIVRLTNIIVGDLYGKKDPLQACHWTDIYINVVLCGTFGAYGDLTTLHNQEIIYDPRRIKKGIRDDLNNTDNRMFTYLRALGIPTNWVTIKTAKLVHSSDFK
jgi:hypothetical protein